MQTYASWVALTLTLEGGPKKSLVLEGGSQRGIASALEDIILLQDNGPPWGVEGGLFWWAFLFLEPKVTTDLGQLFIFMLSAN